MKGVTPTVFVISGMEGSIERMAVALDATIPMAKTAEANGNRIHYVFVSGTNGDKRMLTNLMEFATEGLLGAKASDIHFILGPKELQMLQNVVQLFLAAHEHFAAKPKTEKDDDREEVEKFVIGGKKPVAAAASDVPQDFWPYAADHVCKLHDMLPSRSLDNDISP